MKFKNLITDFRAIAKDIDYWNTLAGGVAQPVVNIEKNDGQTVININTPSIDGGHYHLSLKDNELHTYTSFTPEQGQTEAQWGQDLAPLHHHVFSLPFYASPEGISARFEDNTLRVVIPHSEGHTDDARQIDIDL